MTNDHNDGDGGGFGNPPKKHQFKKGQRSPCPDGGWSTKRAKQAAEAKKAQEKARKADAALNDVIRRVAAEDLNMTLPDGRVMNMARFEATVRRTLDRGLKKDATTSDLSLAYKLYQRVGLLDPPAQGARPQVLVVYPPVSAEQWIKQTEGELLPKNPLEGIPGAEGAFEGPQRRGYVPEDDDD